MDDTRNVTKTCQDDVDDQVCAATTFEEDTERWQNDGEDDFDNVAGYTISFPHRCKYHGMRQRVEVDHKCAYLPVKGMAAVLW